MCKRLKISLEICGLIDSNRLDDSIRLVFMGRAAHLPHTFPRASPSPTHTRAPSYELKASYTPSYELKASYTPSYELRASYTPSYELRASYTPSYELKASYTPSCELKASYTRSYIYYKLDGATHCSRCSQCCSITA
jgi:hypothetical protein